MMRIAVRSVVVMALAAGVGGLLVAPALWPRRVSTTPGRENRAPTLTRWG